MENENTLVEAITKHNKLYWEDGKPEISDVEYDQLVQKLRSINPDHPLINSIETPIVVSTGKVKHKVPMLSLDKAYTLDEVIAWAEKISRNPREEFLIQPKYDGISAHLEGDTLSTRGDGFIGEDITDKLPLIVIESKDHFAHEVRGEIIIRNDDFKNLYSKITRKDGQKYKNSRNAVAGIMGLKDITDMTRQGARLTLVDYELHSTRIPLCELREMWLGIIPPITQMPYPMDGIVIKLADQTYSDSLGCTSHHPRGQIAFKFGNSRAETVLTGVEWSHGKSCLTPVALFNPVELDGVTVKRATLHNVQNIIDRDLHIGDTIIVERAGAVIPYVASSMPGKDRKTCLITECPSCGSTLVRSGPDIECHNPDCFETKLRLLLSAVVKIGIEELGEPTLRKLMLEAGIKNLKDLFNMKPEDVINFKGGNAVKSARNLYDQIQKARKMTDWQLMASLNFYGVGRSLSKTMLEQFTFDELRNLTYDQLSQIEGIGPERAEVIVTGFISQKSFIDELLSCVEIEQTKGMVKSVLPTICFTGKMPEQRSFYENLASQNGFQPVDKVTKDLSILVAVDVTGGSSKLEKARKAGTTVKNLDEWLDSLKK